MPVVALRWHQGEPFCSIVPQMIKSASRNLPSNSSSKHNWTTRCKSSSINYREKIKFKYCTMFSIWYSKTCFQPFIHILPKFICHTASNLTRQMKKQTNNGFNIGNDTSAIVANLSLSDNLWKNFSTQWHQLKTFPSQTKNIFGLSCLLSHPRFVQCSNVDLDPGGVVLAPPTLTVFWKRNLPCALEKSQRVIWGLRSCVRMRASQLAVLTLCLHLTSCSSAQVRSLCLSFFDLMPRTLSAWWWQQFPF